MINFIQSLVQLTEGSFCDSISTQSPVTSLEELPKVATCVGRGSGPFSAPRARSCNSPHTELMSS